jgi:hypothetical protein
MKKYTSRYVLWKVSDAEENDFWFWVKELLYQQDKSADVCLYNFPWRISLVIKFRFVSKYNTQTINTSRQCYRFSAYWQSRTCCSLLSSCLETSQIRSDVKKRNDLGTTVRNWKGIHNEIMRRKHCRNFYIFLLNLVLSCRIWGFLFGSYEELYLLIYNVKLSF